MMEMASDQTQPAALVAGFMLMPQPDGGMALHAHVFEFAHAMFAARQQAAQDKIADLLQQLEQSSESFQVAMLSSGQWQQRAEMAERQRDEWRAVLVEELQARRGLQMHVSDAGDCCTAGGGDAVIVQFKCARCGHETDWMEVATATEAKRGIPCPRCNEEEKGKCNG